MTNNNRRPRDLFELLTSSPNDYDIFNIHGGSDLLDTDFMQVLDDIWKLRYGKEPETRSRQKQKQQLTTNIWRKLLSFKHQKNHEGKS